MEASRQIKRRTLLRGTAGMVGVAAIAACAPVTTSAPGPAASAAPAGPVRGGSATISITREAGELDPQKASIGTTRVYARALYNTLTNMDLKGTVVPELAESWTSPDPNTWVFKLRAGVKFHDGTNFDAAAVKFNMERIMDAATASLWRPELFPNVTAVEVVDPLTVRFKMKDPDVSLPARLSGKAGHIVGPAAVQKWGKDYATHPVGTGPFELVEWVKDDHLTLKRFEGYWQKDEKGNALPYLDKLSYKPIPDATVMFTALRTGQIDLMEAILPADLPKVKAEPGLVAVEGPGTNQVFRFNVSKPPFDKKELRQAVAWALDREAIHKGIYFGTGSPGLFATRPGTWPHDPAGKFYTRDLAKAKAALAAGGQPNGFKFTGLGNNPTIDQQLSQAVKGQLAEAGIDMTVQTLDAAAQAARRTTGDFEMAFSVSPGNPDPSSDFSPFISNTAPNYSRYINKTVDELLIKARSTAVQSERQKFYFQIQAILLDETPMVFLHLDSDIKVMSARLQGYTATPDSYIGNVARLWIKQ